MVFAARGYFPAGHLVKKKKKKVVGGGRVGRVTSFWAVCKHSALLADTKNSAAPCERVAQSKADKTAASVPSCANCVPVCLHAASQNQREGNHNSHALLMVFTNTCTVAAV